MSADNILIILQDKGKVVVYDVNFSDISSHNDWDFPLTSTRSDSLTKYIVNSHYWKVHTCDTIAQAEGFCTGYQRKEVVEYGFGSIIVHPLLARMPDGPKPTKPTNPRKTSRRTFGNR